MMLAVIRDTIRESINRRMGVVLIVFAAVVPLILIGLIRVEHLPNGSVEVAMKGFHNLPAEIFATSTFGGLLEAASSFMVILGIFAMAPLQMSYMEKGRADLVISKGTPRWQFVIGRYLGALGLFAGSIFLMAVVPAFYLWVRTGVSPKHFLIALCISVFTFSTLLALMTFVAIEASHPALPIILAFVYTIFAGLLSARKLVFYQDVITRKWAQWLLDWVYRILPKTAELGQASRKYLAMGTLDSWWPIWSSALFVVGALALACWMMHRKSF
jgi:ABC-type transport system involved in multi-copper enzyme maturation permease subunit